MNRFKRAVTILLALNLLVVGGWIYVKSSNSRFIEEESRIIRENHASGLNKLGILQTEVTQKLFQIKDRVKHSGTISNEDLLFCIETFHAGPKNETNDNWTTLAIDSSAPIRYCKSLEKGQDDLIAKLADRMIEMGQLQQNSGLPCTAMLMLSRVKSPSRNVYFAKLAQSQNQEVRNYAQKCIAKEKS